MELYLVRHGETEWSRARRHTGRTDVPLSPAGEAEARALGAHLDGLEVDRVLASPLARATTTARLAGFGERLETTRALLEFDWARRLVAELTDGDGRVMLFGHGHQLRILTTCYLGLPPDAARHLFLGTASVSVLGREHDWPAVLLWNEQEGSGAPRHEAGVPGWRGISG